MSAIAQDYATKYMECVDFLNREAEILDDRNLGQWIELLTEDIDYRVPLRVTRDRSSGTGFSNKAFFLKEDMGSLKTRVARLDTEYAWAEDPPSRTRHFVSNIRLTEQRENDVDVKCNLIVYRYRLDNPVPDLVSGERHDTLRLVDGQWKLAKRLVLLDSTVLNSQNLSFLL